MVDFQLYSENVFLSFMEDVLGLLSYRRTVGFKQVGITLLDKLYVRAE